MKTIITTDNYEAYLLDYMEGNLSPDEAEQLKAFVAAQGLDWEELTEELPHLEAPQITYEGKESLNQRFGDPELVEGSKGRVIPLYVKIASAAAAAGLLLTVSLWPEKSMPKMEPVAELKPILPTRLITSEDSQTLPPRTVSFVAPQTKVTKQTKAVRTETALLADLQPLKAEGATIALTTTHSVDPEFDLIAYPMNEDLAFSTYDENEFVDEAEDEDELSLIKKGFLKITDGKYESIGNMIHEGIQLAKEEINLAAADFAMTAYYRAEDQIEEVKEHWEKRREP